jgi:hypothetical protein
MKNRALQAHHAAFPPALCNGLPAATHDIK